MAPKKRTDGLPDYVYRGKSAYELRIYLGKNAPRKCIKLCPLDAPMSEVWREYERHTKEQLKTLRWLLRAFESSEQYRQVADKTQAWRSDLIGRILKYPRSNGKDFGSTELKYITPGAIRKYLDARAKDNGPIAGNREVALISVAWNWAAERDMISQANPTPAVRRNKEVPRDRYVTDAEYTIAYQLASRWPYLQPAMELAYLCRMRRAEIINATRTQILTDGFDTLRIKGSRSAITLWSDRLRSAVNWDDSNVKSLYIVHDSKGQKISEAAFKSAWRRLKPLMTKAGIEAFNFHDLKAKGVSDFDGDQLKASGHKDPKMLRTYDRKKHSIESTR